MAPGTDGSKDGLDERLAQARDAELFESEEIVAQEMGDQGQAIVLTKSRIMLIKVGLTATGQVNGHRTATYLLENVTGVRLRRGPMGAVIQICSDGAAAAAPGGAPDNVIIFSNPEKIQKCIDIADKMEELLGKPIERIEPATQGEIGEGSEPVIKPADAMVEEPEFAEVQPQPASVDDFFAGPASLTRPDSPATPEPETEPTPEPETEPAPRLETQRQSLAEEFYAEIVSSQQGEVSQDPPTESSTPPAELLSEKPSDVEDTAPDAAADADFVQQTPEDAGEVELKDQAGEDRADDTDQVGETEPADEVEYVGEPVSVDQVGQVSEAEDEEERTEEEQEEEEEEEEEELLVPLEFRPNPNLPKPGKRRSRGPSKTLIMLAGLAVLVFVGINVTGPLRERTFFLRPRFELPTRKLDGDSLTGQYTQVGEYRSQVDGILNGCIPHVARFKAGLESRDRSVVSNAALAAAAEDTWQQLNHLKVPSGMESAHQSIVSGTSALKTTIAETAAAARSGRRVDWKSSAAKVVAADRSIESGRETIDRTLEGLKEQLSAAE